MIRGQVNIMLMQESFDLNSVSMQSYAVALKEGLRKTMLDQEIIFRKQVQELHRLYRMQKILMDDVGLKQFDGCAAKKACTQSSWLFYSSNPVKRESSVNLIEDAKFSSTAMVGKTHTKSQVLPDGHNSVYYSIHQKPLGLQLHSEQCTSYVDEEMLNLSLSIVKEDRRTRTSTSTCLDQKDNSCIQNIIDLEVEVSTEGISNEEENHAACFTFATMTKCESQSSVLLGKMEKSSHPFGNGGHYHGENSPGFQDCHKALTVNKSSIKDCISHEEGKLDLNQIHWGDSSCYSSDNLVTSRSTASSSRIFGVSFDRTLETTCPSATWRKENSKCLFDASDILQWDDAAKSVVMNSSNTSEISDPKCEGIKGCEAGLTGDKVVSRAQVDPCKDHGYCTSDPENKNIGSTWKLSGGQFTDPDATYMATELVNCENSKDNEFSCAYQSPAEEKDEDGNTPPALCESSCVVNNSGNMKTRQPQINLGDTNFITPDQDLGTSDGNEQGHDCPKRIQPSEASTCVQNAAQLLINFSLGNSPSYQDCSSKAESMKVDKKEMEKLECSDSFEQFVLNLEECNADDCCVSSKPCEIDSMEKRDFGFRIKRGRRFKDFQKEILPGLASLSRHEIQEDINIFEGVLRSREYRKIRASMGDQRSWCAPMKSRRAKHSYVRRKIF